MAKMTKEMMVQFISENSTYYTGKLDLNNLPEDEDVVMKVYKNIKAKMWHVSRKNKSSLVQKVNSLTTMDQLNDFREELTSALSAIDEAEQRLKDAAKASLEAQIKDLQKKLDELNAETE